MLTMRVDISILSKKITKQLIDHIIINAAFLCPTVDRMCKIRTVTQRIKHIPFFGMSDCNTE